MTEANYQKYVKMIWETIQRLTKNENPGLSFTKDIKLTDQERDLLLPYGVSKFIPFSSQLDILLCIIRIFSRLSQKEVFAWISLRDVLDKENTMDNYESSFNFIALLLGIVDLHVKCPIVYDRFTGIFFTNDDTGIHLEKMMDLFSVKVKEIIQSLKKEKLGLK